MENIKGFKGYDKDLTCRGKEYKENTEFTEDLSPKACSIGMHFCKMPLDVFNYYPPKPGTEYTEVESTGDSVEHEDKISTNKLFVKARISISKLFKSHFEIVFSKVKSSKETTNTSGYKAHANTSGNYAHANTSGNYAHANTSGNYAHANTSGNYAHANTSGYYAHANTSGNYAHANTSGNYAHANTSGNYAHANTSGYKAHANTSGNYAHANTSGNYAHANTSGNYAHANTSGNYAHANTSGYKAHANTSGEEAIACALGYQSKAKAENGWIVIVDWRLDEAYNANIKGIYSAKVGRKLKGVKIESDKCYWFENGELKFE